QDFPEPEWVTIACAQVARERVARAASAPVDSDAMTALAHIDPAELAAPELLDAIAASQRLVNHFQAVQQQLIAAFARPGVAVPLADLVDLAVYTGDAARGDRGDGRVSVAASGPPSALPVRSDGTPDYRVLLEQPAWSAA